MPILIGLQVDHERHLAAFNDLCERIDLAKNAGGGAISLLGPTRCGKTVLLDQLQEKIGREVFGPGQLLPGTSFIRGSIPPKPNDIDLYRAILIGLKLRCHNRERMADLRQRVFDAIKDRGIQLIALDECSHCAEPGANLSPRSATDHFKVLVETTGIALVLSGLPKFQRLISENEQFRERSLATVEIHPYQWSVGPDREAFLGAAFALFDVLEEEGYGFDIDQADLVRRLYGASGGRIGRVVELLSHTVELIKQPRALALSDFSRMAKAAFQRRNGLPDMFATDEPTDADLERSFVGVMQEAGLDIPVINLDTYGAMHDPARR